MIGQGRPFGVDVPWARRTWRWMRDHARLLPWAMVVCVGILAATAEARTVGDTDLRLRIEWGGGSARQWIGSLRVEGGRLSKLRYLGLDADQAASIYLKDETLQIRRLVSSAYSGFDISVQAPLAANLVLELAPKDQPQEVHRVTIPLAELVTEVHREDLDNQNNKLVIHREGGDALRVKFDRSSLVFSPGESFSFRVLPHLLGLGDTASIRCLVQLTRARSDDVLWSKEAPLEFILGSDPKPLGPFTIEMPNEEGVYEIRVALLRRRFRDTFVRSKPLRSRRVQLVVITDDAPRDERREWEQIESLDPNHASWMEWLTHVPKLPLFPDFRQEPLGNGKSSPRRHQGQDLVQLQAGGWHAYPLSIREIGAPHLLEVEYPSDVAQTLGISIVEPNGSGEVAPIGLDSGVDVSTRWTVEKPRMLRHRLVFWPRTKTPLVLLMNRRDHGAAMFGTIRVFAGPRTLPAVAQLAAPTVDPTQRRLLAVYFDKPLFPESFSASDAMDPSTGRSQDDWVTFHEGGKRLVEYLKYVGYNGAIVSVACQGSTLYPSELLAPTPQYDTGVFFSDGVDPIRKDILEMLFRLFDREGLTLIPAVQFSSPLPELERLRRETPEKANGIQLADSNDRTWLETYGTSRGIAPYYNPLDKRVQVAMRNVLDELADRYAKHSAFAGLSLQLEPDTYALLPGEDWGRDSVTYARFEQEAGYRVSESGGKKATGFHSRDRRKSWLAWRARVLAGFHKDIQRDLEQRRAGARLYLMTGNMFTAPAVQHRLRPTLPNRTRVAEAMLQVGLDGRHYNDQQQIVLFRPDRIAPRAAPAAHAADINMSTLTGADHYFANSRPGASLFFQQPSTRHLPSFDKVSPFGSDRTRMVLVTQFTPSDNQNRRRFAHRLAVRDLQCIVDGGWMLSMGQEAALRPLLATLSQLPARPFETVKPKASGLPTQPLVVRTLSHEGKTYVYVVNDAPWAVSAEIDMHAPTPCAMQPLGNRELTTPQWIGQQLTWSVELQPYDVVAATFSNSQLEVDTWRVTIDRQSFARLRQQVNTMRARAGKLHRPTKIKALVNPGFETAPDQLPGWRHSRNKGATIKPDTTKPFEGRQCLKMSSEGPIAWIRSDPIPPPRTGRISVILRLRTDTPDKQPPLRLAIEGRLNGKTYYKFADVRQNAKPIGADWGEQPILFHVNDLPVAGLTELSIGFDLMGAGTVWIDDVQVYDLWFLPNERDELMIMSALAAMSLNKGQIADCLRVLGGYWPRFLREYVVEDELRTASLPREMARQQRAFPPPQKMPPRQKSSMLDKVKRRLPKSVFPF